MTTAKITAFALLSFVSATLWAAQPVPFTQQAFDQAARDGQPVLVDVSASWCPTCQAQKPIIDKLSQSAAYKNVAVLNVDFDADKPVLRKFKVGAQSTLIAFKGGKEAGRSVGDTTPDGIESLFKMAGR